MRAENPLSTLHETDSNRVLRHKDSPRVHSLSWEIARKELEKVFKAFADGIAKSFEK